MPRSMTPARRHESTHDMRIDLDRWLRLALVAAGIALLAACGSLPIARDRPARYPAAPVRAERAQVVGIGGAAGHARGAALVAHLHAQAMI